MGDAISGTKFFLYAYIIKFSYLSVYIRFITLETQIQINVHYTTGKTGNFFI